MLPGCVQIRTGGDLGQGLVRSCLSLFLHGFDPCRWFACELPCVVSFVLVFGWRGGAFCCFVEPG